MRQHNAFEQAELILQAALAPAMARRASQGEFVRGFDLFEPNDNYVKVYNPKKDFGPGEWRRMIYQSKPRMRLDDTFGIFDCPEEVT